MIGRIALIVSFVLIGIGCSEDGPAPQGTLPPKVGSTWTFDRWFLDSNRQAGDLIVVVPTVKETDVSSGSEAGLFRLEETLDVDPSSIYLRYEPNGDIRLLHPAYYPLFITLPTGSKADSTPLPPYDISFTENGVYYAVTYTGTIRYVGLEVVDVAGEHVATDHVRINIDATSTIGSSVSNQTVTTDMWYAPSIGYFAKIEAWFDEPPLFGFSLNHGERRQLTKWSLKP